jgi:CubicO group peptidase (beta-lactamase class C family)
MSKPITAVAALTLVEAGQLRLDDPVARYLPEFDNLTVVTGGDVEQPVVEPANKPLTIRHLLTHTAGIPYSSEGGSLAEKLSAQAKVGSAPTLADFSRRIAALPLANHPGERWQYGFSQDVLGRVIEVITGVGFDAYLAQTVFVPLAMHDTGFSVPRDKRDRLVPVHTSLESGQLAIYPNNPAPTGESILAFPAGGEGLFSTAGDYLRFAQMLHNGGELDGVRILSKPTVNMMMSNQLLGLPTQRIENGDYSYGLGIGLRVDLSTGELGSLGQYGWGGYATTDYFADSEYDFIWIYLSQHLPPDQNDVIRSLKNLVYQTIN